MGDGSNETSGIGEIGRPQMMVWTNGLISLLQDIYGCWFCDDVVVHDGQSGAGEVVRCC